MCLTLHPEWASVPSHLTLSAEAIHIWRARLDPSPWTLQRFAQTLSTDEEQRAERFRLERDRRRFVAGRGTLRAILGRYLEIEPGQIRFCYTASGKPALVLPTSKFPISPLEFNLSHSQELMVCAVTRSGQIGIDLEYLRPIADLEGLTQRFFSKQEHIAIQRLPADQQVRLFFQHWTCKEALLKATGEGLADLSKIEVAIADGKARLSRWTGKSHLTHPWGLNLFIPCPDYIAALAVNLPVLASVPKPDQITYWDWWEKDEG